MINKYDKEFLIHFLNKHYYHSQPDIELAESNFKIFKIKKNLERMDEIQSKLEKISSVDKEWIRLHKEHLELSEDISKLTEN